MFASRITLIAAMVVAGCSPDGDAGDRWGGTVDTLDNGAVVVSNPAAPLWGDSEGWVLREDLRIGAVEGTGPEVFASVSALAVDARGRVHVLDARASEVRVFGPDGQHVRTIGGPGAGPGELSRAIGLAFANSGALWVVDAGNARYSVFDTAGAFMTTHRRPLGFFRIPWPGGFLADDTFVDVGVGDSADPRHPAELLVRYADTLEPLDTTHIPSLRTDPITLRRANGGPVMSFPDPYGPQLAWRFDARGFLWTAVTDRYELVQRSLRGDTVRIIRRAAPAVAVTAADRDDALERISERVAEVGPGASLDRDPRVPDVKPALVRFYVDAGGGLWVEPSRAAGERQHFDIFDADGRYLGRVSPEHEIQSDPMPVFTPDAVLAVVRDSLDVPYVVRLRIERN
jgi:hypothetical protein